MGERILVYDMLYKGKIWILSLELAERLIKEIHEHPTNRHPGIRKIIDKI